MFAVADGLGGAGGGGIASSLVAARLSALVSDSRFRLAGHEERVRLVAATLRDAHRAIREQSTQIGLAGMGTTVVTVLVDSGARRGTVLHAGDSRAYVLHGEKLDRLTEDDTMATQVAKRILAEGGKPLGPIPLLQGKLTNAVGMQAELSLSERTVPTLPGDVLFLCSDGVTRHLSDDDICGILRSAEPAGMGEAADRMVTAANDRGGADNISCVCVRVTAAAVPAKRPGHRALRALVLAGLLAAAVALACVGYRLIGQMAVNAELSGQTAESPDQIQLRNHFYSLVHQARRTGDWSRTASFLRRFCVELTSSCADGDLTLYALSMCHVYRQALQGDGERIDAVASLYSLPSRFPALNAFAPLPLGDRPGYRGTAPELVCRRFTLEQESVRTTWKRAAALWHLLVVMLEPRDIDRIVADPVAEPGDGGAPAGHEHVAGQAVRDAVAAAEAALQRCTPWDTPAQRLATYAETGACLERAAAQWATCLQQRLELLRRHAASPRPSGAAHLLSPEQLAELQAALSQPLGGTSEVRALIALKARLQRALHRK